MDVARTLPASRYNMPFENWTLCEWDGLHEGYNKCTLPLLPDVPALTRVPLEVDHITEATSPRTLEPTFRAVSEYNSHLGYVGQLDEGKRAALSQSVVRRVTEMRRISEQARKEMSAQVDALTGAVRDFVDYVKHGELDFENPAWASTSKVPHNSTALATAATRADYQSPGPWRAVRARKRNEDHGS